MFLHIYIYIYITYVYIYIYIYIYTYIFQTSHNQKPFATASPPGNTPLPILFKPSAPKDVVSRKGFLTRQGPHGHGSTCSAELDGQLLRVVACVIWVHVQDSLGNCLSWSEVALYLREIGNPATSQCRNLEPEVGVTHGPNIPQAQRKGPGSAAAAGDEEELGESLGVT